MKHFKTLCCLCITAWKRERETEREKEGERERDTYEIRVRVFSRRIHSQFTKDSESDIHYVYFLLIRSCKIGAYFLFTLLLVVY